MGHTGMDMGSMAEVMPLPPNSIPMKGSVISNALRLRHLEL